MTLIIAKIVNDDIQIISDTKITDVFLGSQNPLLGQLKTVLLNPYISISFSGLPDYVNDVLEPFYKSEFPDFNSILVVNSILIKCLEINRKSENLTNFIICYLHQNKPKIFRISNYQIEPNLKTAWIGDIIGFNKYQEYYHSLEKIIEFDKMEDAFEKVINDSSVETVGDFVIRVANERDKSDEIEFLNYQINRIRYFGPYNFVNIDNEKFMVKHASSQKGGYGFSLFRSCDPQRPAIGFHFHVGGFGLIFFPKLNYTNGAIIQNQPDGEAFAMEIKNKYGFDVHGLLVSKKGLSFKHINTSACYK
ncbi:hypothetical protein ACFSKN_18800 [Mariniflexile gromovii]|uniref:Uncharacterized protein n=1 Tax=Mariniflexile gromovii TaxID=362523 RepID=A0ABS4BWF0_9FLAO|nr:hypothetical protein [Mariniflexile gromovii]MBP0904331.1 hypothetical protein [Mariniflexile gromovii]